MTDEEITNLKKKITIEPRQDSDLIDIIVKHESRHMAVSLANAIAKTTISRLRTTEQHRKERAIEALDAEIKAQQDLVAGRRHDLLLVLKSYQIPFPTDETSFPDPGTIKPDANIDPKIYGLREHTYRQALTFFTKARALLHEMKIKQQETRDILAEEKPTMLIHQRAK